MIRKSIFRRLIIFNLRINTEDTSQSKTQTSRHTLRDASKPYSFNRNDSLSEAKIHFFQRFLRGNLLSKADLLGLFA